jgi:hypothetical protein
VVVAIALAVSLLSATGRRRSGSELSGAWISIVFLTLLGVLNLRAVFAAEAHEWCAGRAQGALAGRLGRSPIPRAWRWWGRCSRCPSTR